MIQPAKWKRNTEGLRKTAQTKAESTRRRADEAIQLLIKERRSINFTTVAETAHVSTAWLYKHEGIKKRIVHLRAQQSPKAKIRLAPQEQTSNASKDALIALLRKRVKEQEEDIKKLRRQVEVAYGQLARQQ